MATFDFDFFYAEEQAEGSDAWLRENWERAAILLERLVRDLNTSSSDVDDIDVSSSDR